MQCSACDATNAAGSKFCSECGAALARACPSCSTPVVASAKFCSECGADLAAGEPSGVTDSPESVADRRFVSTLFADLVDYTTFAEGRDPDEVRDLLTVYFDRSRAIIEKFGGVVEKFIGDAIFGVWGTEVVREDDAERAVRAGLDLVSMVSALGDEQGHHGLRLRAGVMSGATAVGPGGNESTGMIVGDLVNTAARLQSVAEPGTVFVGRATHEVTARSIVYEARGNLTVKGKTDAVEAWRAVRPAGRLGSIEHTQRELPFVGREREMRLFTDWLDATTVEQRARLVSVTGEAGIGKSRLAKEFLHHVDGYADDVYWHQGRSPSYGDGVPMWSLIEMVRQRAGILEDEQDSRARTRLHTMLVEFVDDADEREWIGSWMAGLLGLGDMPPGERSELLSALRSLFLHIARRGTTVLVFEDLHWADDSVVEFIADLVDRSTRSSILVITLARPELLERHPGFGSQQRASVNVSLAGLNDDDLRSAVGEFLDGQLPELVDRIVARAAGFPLYAAEILRMLINDGTLVDTDGGYEWRGDDGDLAIPETLHAVIGARLDRLDADDRAVLQDGAVLGLTFHGDGLSAFSETGAPRDIAEVLRRLVRLDLLEVIDDPRSPERGQYRFVQGLIQELAYDRLNRRERRSRHLAAAAYFGREDDPELAGVVAKHYLGAYECSPDGEAREELVQRAIDSLVEAAERSAAMHSDRAAMELYDRAAAIAPDHSDATEWLKAAASSAISDSDKGRALAYLDTAEAIASSSDDPRDLMGVAVARADVLNSFFDSGEAAVVIEPVYRQLESVDDEFSLTIAAEAVRSFMLTLRPDDAIEAAERALPVAERLGLTSLIVELLISRSTALSFGGRVVEGTAGLIGAFDVAEREGLTSQMARAANNLMSTMFSIHAPSAEAWMRRLRSVASRSGVRDWMLRSYIHEASLLVVNGDLGGARAVLDTLDDQGLDSHWSEVAETVHVSLDRRAGVDGADERIEALLESLGDHSDPQTADLAATIRLKRDALCLRWDEVLAHMAEMFELDPSVWRLHASVRRGDVGVPQTLREFLERHAAGPARRAVTALFDAVDTAASGRLDAAAEEFGAAIEALEASTSAEVALLGRATMVASLGRDHPASEPVSTAIAEWIETHELWGFVPMMVDVAPTLAVARERHAG